MNKKKLIEITFCAAALILCAVCGWITWAAGSKIDTAPSMTGQAAFPSGDPPLEIPAASSADETPDSDSITLTCRIVSGADTGILILESQTDAADIYMLNINKHSFTAQSPEFERLENDMLLRITYDGTILGSYPAQFGGILEILVLEGGTDNPEELYPDVPDELWETDPESNGGITDLAQT